MIGMTTVTFRNKSVEEVIYLAIKAGLNCIEWGADVHVKPGDIETAKRVRSICEDNDIKCDSYGSYFFLGKTPVEEFQAVVDTAKALGAKYIRVIAGDWTIKRTSKDFKEEEFNKIVEDLKAMVKMVEGTDIVIASEFHNNTFNDCAESSKKLIQAVNSPHYKTYWQTVTYDGKDLEYLKELKDDIVTAHIFAWQANGVRMPLKKSEGLFREVHKILGDDVNYIMEFVKGDSAKQFLQDAKVLHNILGE